MRTEDDTDRRRRGTPAGAQRPGEIVAFTDDDTVPARDWLCSGLQAFADNVDGVAGRIIVPLPEAPTDFERNMAGLERAEFATANCFYRRSALAAVGGFDERFTAPWREDADLSSRCSNAGADWNGCRTPSSSILSAAAGGQ
jgi:cellulose synthase/poly-beta-1,6-N-acetylglucosamine synthase-like glycosyltransferase